MMTPGPPPIFLEIDRAMRAGDMTRATALACQALDSGHADPVLFSLRSHWHETHGRVDAALRDLERARAMAPPDGRTLAAAGRCLTKLGRLEEARLVLDEAVTLAPALAVAHYEKGFALDQMGELLAAQQSYQQAMALDPHLADAPARLAALAARRSDWSRARDLAARALALQPGNAVAQFALVMVDMASGEFTAAEQRARQVAGSSQTTDQARAHALNFLADSLDAQNRPGEAFAAYVAANQILLDLFASRFESQESGLPFALRMTGELEQTGGWKRAPATRTPMPTPVFVSGFARAGTTLLGQILDSHPRFMTLEEKPLLIEGMQEFLAPRGGMARLAALSEEECEPYRALYWRHVREQGGEIDGKIVVDQTPLNTLHLALIARLFPGAPIVFALRDPRDVVLSCFRRLFVVNPYTVEFLSLDRTARFYDATMRHALLAREKLPLRFHDLRNEDLVADFDGRIRALCDFLEVPFDPAMARFAERSKSRGVATPSATQVARGLSSDGIGQWRRYEVQLGAVLPLLAPWVRHFGY
ncbi:MAG TPA: sulfotransferase [Rhizomicrobium sp.]|nr:sulfotransferase [Rhizomicrobium sp.]